jgi:hypothetical protein
VSSGVQQLRTIVQEGIRIQRGNSERVNYVDATNALGDAIARQNHVIFGRRLRSGRHRQKATTSLGQPV